jgi:formylglycine-generating enzyme required for sulfatase activity
MARGHRVPKAGCILALVALLTVGLAQTILAGALPPYPEAEPFDPQSAPASAGQNASMVRIAAGDYPIGAPARHPLGDRAAMPAHEVTLRAFKIDRTEVTNSQFAEFLNALPSKASGTALAGAVGPANIPGEARWLFQSGGRAGRHAIIELDDDDGLIGLRDGRFAPNPGREEHPVTETTWAGALAYCRWRGARLPTEAEWEAAARGRERRTFPWGEAAPSTELAVIGRRSGQTLPVGSRRNGATPEGLLDMAGSVSEWTSTLDRPYPYSPDDGRENSEDAGERIVRGGDYVFNSGPERLTGWNRTIWSRNPTSGHRHIGFRCAAND